MIRRVAFPVIVALIAVVPAAAQKKEAPIDSTALFMAFGDNEAKADKSYTGKTLEFQRKLNKVMKNDDGTYTIGFVIFESAGAAAREYPPSLLCRLTKEASKTVADLEKGTEVVVRGVCEGRKKDRAAYMEYVVLFKDCEIAKAAPPKRKK